MRSTRAKTEPEQRERECVGTLTLREPEGVLTFRKPEARLTFRKPEGPLTFREPEGALRFWFRKAEARLTFPFSIFLFSIFFLLTGALVGCGGELGAPLPRAHDGDETPRRGGTLHLGAFADIRGLDPAITSDGLATPVIALLFSGLVEYDESGNLVPRIAERWDVENDGRTYRFTLREGVRFHDGEELTADDVKRSIERAVQQTHHQLGRKSVDREAREQ